MSKLIELLPGRTTYTSPCGLVRVVLDSETETAYVEAHHDADSTVIRVVLDAFCIELMHECETPTEYLGDGWARIWALGDALPYIGDDEMVMRY